MQSVTLFPYPALKFIPRLFLVFLVLGICGCQFANFGKQAAITPGANTNPCVVLALPNSGPYAPWGKKIKAGADLAIEELRKTGTNVQLHTLNTEDPLWITKLRALPEMCVLVGGPLQEKSYLEAKKSGVLAEKAFFTFLPALQSGEEGIVAWRFFPSPQDQIEALKKVGVNDLNVRTYGAFYPEDAYGRKMTDLLEKALQREHIPLQKASYNPSMPSAWSKSAAGLIKPEKMENSNQVIPQTSFEALFVPDSWKHMDMITTSLLYNGEDRLILMGTNLWESALSGKPVAKPAKYELAIFPAAWNSAKAPKKLTDANADFWMALGFDFANFASYLGLTTKPESLLITSLAQKSSPKIRANAPISWNDTGIASQNLYIFQISSKGMKPLDVEQFKRTRANTMERAALRFQGIREADLAPQPEPQPVMEMAPLGQPPVEQPVLPRVEQAPLSTVPQSSYKLRLPTKK